MESAVNDGDDAMGRLGGDSELESSRITILHMDKGETALREVDCIMNVLDSGRRKVIARS